MSGSFPCRRGGVGEADEEGGRRRWGERGREKEGRTEGDEEVELECESEIPGSCISCILNEVGHTRTRRDRHRHPTREDAANAQACHFFFTSAFFLLLFSGHSSPCLLSFSPLLLVLLLDRRNRNRVQMQERGREAKENRNYRNERFVAENKRSGKRRRRRSGESIEIIIRLSFSLCPSVCLSVSLSLLECNHSIDLRANDCKVKLLSCVGGTSARRPTSTRNP